MLVLQMTDDHQASDGNFFKFLQNQSSIKKEVHKYQTCSTNINRTTFRNKAGPGIDISPLISFSFLFTSEGRQ